MHRLISISMTAALAVGTICVAHAGGVAARAAQRPKAAVTAEARAARRAATLEAPTSGAEDGGSGVNIDGGGDWLGQLTAAGTRLLFNADTGLGFLDATDPAAPSLQLHDLYGYGCYDPKVRGNVAYCPMGEHGLQALGM